MTPADRLHLVERLLRVRRLELDGATEGERSAAGLAFDRVAGAHVPDLEQARAEVDELQAKLDANPQAKLVAQAPAPARPTFVVHGGWAWESTTGTADTSTWGWAA